MSSPHNRLQSSNQSKNSNAFADLLGPMAFTPTSQKPLSAIQPQAKSDYIVKNMPVNQTPISNGSNTLYTSQNYDQSSAALRQKDGNIGSLDILGKINPLPSSSKPQYQSSSTPTLLQTIPVRENDTKLDPFSDLQLGSSQINDKPKSQTPTVFKTASSNFIPTTSQPTKNVDRQNNPKRTESTGFQWENQPILVQGAKAAPDIFDVEFLGNTNKHPSITALEDDILGPLSLPVSEAKKVLENDHLPKLYNKPNATQFEMDLEQLNSMGFDHEVAAASLAENEGNIQKTINQLVSHQQDSHLENVLPNADKPEVAMESLINMGFSPHDAEDALFSCNGDLERALEFLVQRKEEPLKKDVVSNATKIVGAIGLSVLKNAKSVFNSSRQKVGEVLTDFNSGSNRTTDFPGVKEEEWAKPSFTDTPPLHKNIQTEKAPSPASTTGKEYEDNAKSSAQKYKISPLLGEGQTSEPLLSFENEQAPLKIPLPSKPILKKNTITGLNFPAVIQVTASAEVIEKSNLLRASGNEFYKKGQFGDAEIVYSNAIAVLPAKHNLLLPLYNNRAACRIKNGDNRGAIDDCNLILEQDPVDIKALLRRATAYEALENWEGARDDYRKLMGLDSNIKGVSIGLARANAALQPKNPALTNPATLTNNPSSAVKPVDKFVKKAVDEAVQKLRESNEASEQIENEKFAASQAVNAKVDAWKKNKETNIRALLSSLELILWPECSWKPCNLGELISPAQVKGKYIRAVAKLHPDKLGPNCTIEQQLIASAAFTILNKAWDTFKIANNI